MTVSNKRVPTVSDVEIQRGFQQIYDDLNELIDAVNKGNTTHKRKSNIGKSGDIRIRKKASGAYMLELKTDEGWIESTNTTSSGFKFQDKSEDQDLTVEGA